MTEERSEKTEHRMGKDRRRFKRRHLLYYLKVTDLNGYPLGHLVDITEEGVLLLGEEPFSEGDYVTFHMNLPSGFDSEEKIEIQARCQWTKISTKPHLFEGGFQFFEVSPSVRALIRQLIEEFGMQDDLNHDGRPSGYPTKDPSP